MRWLPLDSRKVRILTAFLFSTSVLGFAAGQQLGHLVRSPDHVKHTQSERIRAQKAAPTSPPHVTTQSPRSTKQVELVHVVAVPPTPTATPIATPAAAATQAPARAHSQASGNAKSSHARDHHTGKTHGKAKEHSHPKTKGRKDSGPEQHASRSSANQSGGHDHIGKQPRDHAGKGHGDKRDRKNE